jgi:hypothetical protein
MVHYHNFIQGSEEWFAFKKGKLSASNATPIGACGKGLNTYAMELAMNLCDVEDERYTNSDIERGNELEGFARKSYEFEFGVNVQEIGCITNDKYENVCVSPDGLISENGGCEIKARNSKKHFALIQGETADIPFNQIQMTLLVTEREWWDFVSFNPNFSKPLFVTRFYPDEKYFEKLKKGFEIGNELINKYVNNYKKFEL